MGAPFHSSCMVVMQRDFQRVSKPRSPRPRRLPTFTACGPRGLPSRGVKCVFQTGDHGVDFVARRCTPEAEADGAHAHFGRDAHRLQHRRQLDAAGVTCRSRRGRDAIEPRQYLGADPADEGNIERVRQAMRGMAVEDDAIAESLLQLLPKMVAQSRAPAPSAQDRAQARRPCRARPQAAHSPCPRAGRPRVRHRESAVRATRHGARTKRRPPSAHRPCGRQSTEDRRRVRSTSVGILPTDWAASV